MIIITPSGSMVWFLAIILLSIVRSSHQTVYTCNASVSCGCSANSAVVNRIVGGENANASTWGWAVSISIGGIYLCGGSIISSSWVITAAHCVHGFTASQVTIYAGSNQRFSGTQRRTGSKVIIHPSYNAVTYVNDVALVKLASPLSMSDPHVSSICLPYVSSSILSASEWPPASTSVVAVGWGTLTESGTLPLTLQQVTVQIVDYRLLQCSSLIDDWHTQLCAGVSGGGRDTCQGDSGGPLMMFTSSRQWVLIGLTSNGIGCARAGYPGVYTRVVAFESWINTNTNGAVYTLIPSIPTTISTSTTRPTSTTRSTSTTRRTSTARTVSITRSTSTTRPASTTRHG